MIDGDDEAQSETELHGRQVDRRVTITGARRMLGMIGRNYDDQEMAEILNILYGMAEQAYQGHKDEL